MPRLPAGLAPLLLLLSASPAVAQKEFGFDNRKPSGQPYLSPEETVKRMKVAPEFEVKLFAGEPKVINPIAFTIDEKGRVWVVECFEYPSRTPKGKAPRDRIVILEDTDGDGVCDKRTVFAEGKDFPVPAERAKQGLGAFDLASGIEVGHGGVFVGAPPYLWFIENKNDKPGKFETLLTGFGSEDTHETLNTFQWGPDGWLYGLHGVFTRSNVKSAQLDGPETRMNAAVWRYHPRTKKFEIFAEGTSNPWGMDWRNTDGQFILACCVIPHLFHMVPGGVYKRQAGASLNPYAYGEIKEICDHTFHRESGWAHAGLISLDAPHIPEKYRNSVIFGSIHGCSIKQNILKPNGSSFTASRGDDFLVSGDKNVRPINLKWGPNGDIYLIDWHDQNPCHQAKAEDWDYERGRVYRIQVKGAATKKAEDLGKKTSQELAAMVNDPNPYRYRTGLRLLASRSIEDRKQVAAPLEAKPESMSMREWWLVMSVTKSYAVESAKLTGNQNPGSRDTEWTIRSLWHADEVHAGIIPVLADCVTLPLSAGVRRELASVAIRLAGERDVLPLLHALMQRKEDAADPQIPHLVWLAYEKVIAKKAGAANPAEKELAWLAEQAPDNSFVRDQIVPRVMRRLVATGKLEDLALCLKFVADVADVNSREKALDGLAVALDKQTVAPPDGWAALRPELAKDPRLAPLANKLAVSFRDPAALKRAYDAAHDLTLTPDARAEAVRQVVQLRHPQARALVHSALRQEADPRVRAEAARQLAAFDDPKIADETVRDWKQFPRPVRAELANGLASRKEWARALLKGMAAGAVDRADVTDNVVTRIQAFRDPELNALIEKSWGRTRPTPKELDAQIDKMRGDLAAGPASFARGKVVFDNQCAKCHKFDGRGSEVGPPLDGAARDVEYILANVIDPNRVIGAPYFQRIARTLDGRVEQGLLAEEDDRFITLKVENGVLKKLKKDDLDGPVTVLEKSMMPEGLTAGMSAQDFRDLVRYLTANPPLSDVTVNGKPVSAGVLGRIQVTGATAIEADVAAAADVTTQLLLDGPAAFEATLDGKPVTPAAQLTLAKGDHKLRVAVKPRAGAATVTVRLLDPDRKLTYPDPGAKK